MTLLNMSLSAAILILVILIIRSLALHRLPKKTLLALWAVALCRLLIPVSIPSPFSIFEAANVLRSKYSATDVQMTETTVNHMIDIAAGTYRSPLVEAAASSVSPFLMIWLVGMIASAMFFLITHLRCRREYKTALPANNEFVQAWKSGHPTWRKVEIRQSDRISTPLTYGIFRPVILLPKTIDWADETRLGYILMHEFVHIRRFDTLTKLLLVAALCVHWFNPLVWVMYILYNRDIELSCDETVVRSFGETLKSSYALTLIGLAEKNNGFAPLINHFSKNAIEERIVAIMKMKRTSILGVVLASALVVGTVTVFATNAASGADHKPEATYAEEAAHTETPENRAKMFAVYEPYGLTYTASTDQLFYKGELVRYFEDFYPIGESSSTGIDYLNEKGTIDVHGVRNKSKLPQSDSTVDSGGKLIGVETYSQAEFDARDIDALKSPSQAYAVSDDESYTGDDTASTQELFQGSASTASSSEDTMTPDELAKMYAVYEPFGLTYDKKKDYFYYNGKLVREFLDIISSNGEVMDSGKFQGSIRQIYNPDDKGEINIQTVRDYTADGEGKLTGIEIVD